MKTIRIPLCDYEILLGLNDDGSVASCALGGPDERLVAEADRVLRDLLSSQGGIARVIAAREDPSHAGAKLARELGLPA